MVFGRLQRGSVGGGCDATGEAQLVLGDRFEKTCLRAALFAKYGGFYSACTVDWVSSERATSGR